MRPKTLSLFSLVLGVGFAVYFSNCWYGDIFFLSFLGAFSFYVGVKKILAVVVVDFFCDVLFFDVETRYWFGAEFSESSLSKKLW